MHAHLRDQRYSAESLLLSALGAVTGTALGAAATYAVALQRGWQPLIPATALLAGFGAALLTGTTAGLYPAHRAARLSPTDALGTT